MTIVRFDGFVLHKRFLPPEEQSALVDDVRAIAKAAPFARPVTPGGKKMSVSMTSAGAVGWTTDRTGYRYEEAQPDGAPWPPIPESADSRAWWRKLPRQAGTPSCDLRPKH